MKVFYIDESWPIVCIKISGNPKTEEDIQKIIKIWTNIYIVSMSYEQKFKLIFDIYKLLIFLYLFEQPSH